MQAACDRMDRMRENNRQLIGEQNIAVELIRETRDHSDGESNDADPNQNTNRLGHARLPELRPLVGKMVEIRVVEAAESAIDRLLDSDYHADCEADISPEVSLADVRARLASIPGNMSADFAAERDER